MTARMVLEGSLVTEGGGEGERPAREGRGWGEGAGDRGEAMLRGSDVKISKVTGPALSSRAGSEE